MPIWSEILREVTPQDGANPDYDGVRRKYLHQLNAHTGRDVILYVSGWLQKPNAEPSVTTIGDEDIHALMEVTAKLRGPNLDLVMHSPGGALEAAEAIVSYLRSRFSHIRVIVPQLAMSAATMIACAADEIVMGKHSFLGPTDPQFPLATPLGTRLVPAQSVLDQFDKAQRECADPAKLAAWMPILGQYGPDLLVRCEKALEMSKELVSQWLQNYMFRNVPDRQDRADRVATWLSNHANFNSHSRHLSRPELVRNGIDIQELERDEALQDLSLSVFHAAILAVTATPAVRIIENHRGGAFIKVINAPPPPALQIGIGGQPPPT